ncbi:aspartate--tRNA ligase [Allofustis seminis]|uniref:aspartate--tRNA ligase n=1 Tax=Allofustis seminis TaxID=166939 RepID=UPI000361F3AC|nr:aspartate--tRNA ligase [Allofustis seminis]
MERTNYCGRINQTYLGQDVVLKGWVQRRRDLGGMVFVDLRDREGIVQVVFNEETNEKVLKTAHELHSEDVIEVIGEVAERIDGQKNENLATGSIEVVAKDLKILNAAQTPPFNIAHHEGTSNDLRLKYRYLDLRNERMQRNLMLRHKVTHAIRNFLDKHQFIDIETPYLTKSTPEGARDYLVPSRVHDGKFYALPQSPQILKQLLMASGFDRYYQIVRCFRDEDLRGDRQPEFTQVDLEMSFLSEEEIRNLMEEMLKYVVKQTSGQEIKASFPVMNYDDAMANYGSDKPDIRFEMLLKDVTGVVKNCDFKVFSSTIEQGGAVKGLTVAGGADQFTRKQIDALQEIVSQHGAKGLAWLKVTEEGFSGPIARFFEEEALQSSLMDAMGAEAGDLLLFVADKLQVVHAALGDLRVHLGQMLKLYAPDELAFLWVVNWPLYEYDEEQGRFVASHHPFTRPQAQDIEKLSTNPYDIRAQAYDIVLNGYEVGGGSLRIHERELQEMMLHTLGFSDEEMYQQFGFLLEAMNYGFPPHGGIALGLDRLVMILANEPNIREVIAFPKNGKAADPLTGAPSMVSKDQLDELHLKVTASKEKMVADNVFDFGQEDE